jgi:hypothetical protein
MSVTRQGKRRLCVKLLGLQQQPINAWRYLRAFSTCHSERSRARLCNSRREAVGARCREESVLRLRWIEVVHG